MCYTLDCLISLEHGIRIHHLGLPDLAWTLYLLYWDQLCLQLLLNKCVWFLHSLVKHKFPHWNILHVHLWSFQTTHRVKLCMMILPTKIGTLHRLDYFSHMITALQTSMYQNIAKLLNQPISKCSKFSLNQGSFYFSPESRLPFWLMLTKKCASSRLKKSNFDSRRKQCFLIRNSI